MGKTTTQVDLSKEPDTVIEQSPAPGARTDKGTKIDLTLSPPQVQVPKLLGETRHYAEESLKERQLVAEVTEEHRQEKINDTVLSTSPSSGEWVKPGTKVEVVVASNPEGPQNEHQTSSNQGVDRSEAVPTTHLSNTVRVPNLIGIPLSQARSQLQAMGLSVGINNGEQRQGVAGDTVLAQSPSPGQGVKPGSQVDITYAESPASQPRPDQTGQKSLPNFAGTWEWYETWSNGTQGTIGTSNRTTVISQNGDLVTVHNRALKITPAGTLTGRSFTKGNGYPVPEDQAEVIRNFTWRLEGSILVREDVIDYTQRYSSHPPKQGNRLDKYKRISP
jgi:beta-lactam-binding protein with PASTA domain